MNDKVASREGYEVWENVVGGTVWLTVLGERNREKQVPLTGQRSRQRLSTEDRLIMQDAALDAEQDVFTNGMLRRVDADQNEDERTRSNQVFRDGDLVAAFDFKGREFSDFVHELNLLNAGRMQRLITHVDPSESQRQAIADRLAELRPQSTPLSDVPVR